MALVLLPIAMSVGLAIDARSVMSARDRMKDAADTAVLAALSYSTSSGNRAKVAESAFKANLPEDLLALSPSFSVSITGPAGDPRATGTFSANIPINFGGLFGVKSLPVEGKAVAGMSLGGSLDIDFWLDASGSMTIAADEAGRDKLEASKIKCAFACHLDGDDTTAHAMGVKLRVDVMKESVGDLISTLSGMASAGQTIRFRISALATEFETRLGWTSDITKVRASVSNFTLAADKKGSDSHLDETMEEGAEELDDDPSTSAREIVVLVTDGMMYKDPSGPISKANCDAIKKRGISIAVVQLKYVKLNDDRFTKRVAPYFDQLGPALQACASPNMFFYGDTPAEIQNAFGQLAGQLRSGLRLIE